MLKLSTRVIALVSLGLVACATAHATKPEMPVLGYTQAAKMYVGVDRCGKSGLMDPATAAYGTSVVKDFLSPFTYDMARLDAEVNEWAQSPVGPTKEQCNGMAMAILEWKQGHDAKQGQQVSAMAPTPQPVYTTCNKIGTQTFCNSY